MFPDVPFFWGHRGAKGQGSSLKTHGDCVVFSKYRGQYWVAYLEADSGPRHARGSILKDMLEVQPLLTQQGLHDREAVRPAIRTLPSSPLSFPDTFSIGEASPGGAG